MPGFVKRHATAAAAAEAMRRARALRAAGVPTPAARAGRDARTVDFDVIEGQAGPDGLRLGLAALLRPVAQLHRAPVAGLPRHDPYLRIRPRLALVTDPAIRGVLGTPVPAGGATLHGDLHVGQLMVAPDDRVWIVDLDDMATGPAEADLANFVAHLATSGPVERFGQALGRWRGEVLQAWSELAAAADTERFALFLRLALVRRHLKLRQAGRPDFEVQVARQLSAG